MIEYEQSESESNLCSLHAALDDIIVNNNVSDCILISCLRKAIEKAYLLGVGQGFLTACGYYLHESRERLPDAYWVTITDDGGEQVFIKVNYTLLNCLKEQFSGDVIYDGDRVRFIAGPELK